MTVSRIMTRNPFTVEAGTSVIDARELMRREKVRRMPRSGWGQGYCWLDRRR